MRRRPAGLTDDEAFEAAVREAAVHLSAAVVGYDPAGEVRLSGAHLAGTVDLRNVRQICRLQRRELWSDIVVEHLAGLAAAAARHPVIHELRDVRPRLRSRLYGEGDLLLEDVAGRVVAPGLVEALVVADDAIATVPATVADRWGVDLGLLLAEARDNVRRSGMPPGRDIDLDGVVLTAVESASFFTTTALFWLEEYLPVPADGALVAVPNRHLLLAYPVRDATVVDAAQALLVNAGEFHERGPGSLSPHLYWWRDGGLTLLPALVEPTRIEFRPPAEFATVLQRLL